jgi:hypothetical protein
VAAGTAVDSMAADSTVAASMVAAAADIAKPYRHFETAIGGVQPPISFPPFKTGASKIR